MSPERSDTLEPPAAGPSTPEADPPTVVVRARAGDVARLNGTSHVKADAESAPDRDEPVIKLSEQPLTMARTPLAFLLALVALVGVEVYMHRLPPRDVIPYQNTGRESYAAVRNYLHIDGPARVAFVGSSRGREAIMVPDLRRHC